MKEKTDKKIKWWQYNPEMTEKQGRLGNRIIGLGGIVFGAIISSPQINNPVADYFLDISGAIFVIKGSADLISGDHGYVCSKIVNSLSRGKVKITYKYNKFTI